MIVLETIPTSYTTMVASLAVRSRVPLLLSTRHFLISCHPFTAEINCHMPDRLLVIFCTRFLVPSAVVTALLRNSGDHARGHPVPFLHSPAPGSLSPSHRRESAVGLPLRAFEGGCALVCPHHMSSAIV